MLKFAALAGLLAGLCGAAHSTTCYTVYGADNKVMYSSVKTPVDLTEAIGDTVPARFGPGASMVAGDTPQFCPELALKQPVAAKAAAANPLAFAEEFRARDATGGAQAQAKVTGTQVVLRRGYVYKIPRP
ncbi:hypothetical protein HHL11_28060 [Ramlibacter sp. G-1-2-2]|uniref:Uncharacterized protein n=1 Tax=Ramlibacter agri TaxID=2728837 RepID=A0A848HB01_9BURK|nr:hypothetical protein [Ramlibacter agri]NML47637.1 hypothetical protein [Ramlibacter agri]